LGWGGRCHPVRHRCQASWIAAYSTINLTRQFGTAVNHAFLTDLTAGSPPLLLGRPLYEASALDGTINAGADNYMMIAGNSTAITSSKESG
jgi:HK97 family phage major capsid protein